MHTKYRGFDIIRVSDRFDVYKNGFKYASCNTGWSCHVWIDEFLLP